MLKKGIELETEIEPEPIQNIIDLGKTSNTASLLWLVDLLSLNATI